MIENNEGLLEFPLRLSKTCLLNIRDDNTFITPLAIQVAFDALSLQKNKTLNVNVDKKWPFYFYNYFIVNQDLSDEFHQISNQEIIKSYNTELTFCNSNDIEQRKWVFNQIIKNLTDQSLTFIVLIQKILEQLTAEPISLLSCSSFTFQPLKSEHWQQLWSLKFHSNIHLSIETEFYFTKGFFHVAFHDTFHKIEIPGQIVDGIQMKLIILLPQCSSDLVHLYANISEYLNTPVVSAYVGVCIPNMSMDIHMNLNESLKLLNDLYNRNNLVELNQEIHLSSANSLGHFILDMNVNKPKEVSSHGCFHSIDLSPTSPWVFFANRPFLFLIAHEEKYLLIGQMLRPRIQHQTKSYLSKLKP